MLSAAFRSALYDGDVSRTRHLWAEVAPDMPQPESHAEAEVIMHQARTAADSVPIHKRIYSHAFLDERGLPSQLPDGMKPPRDRKGPPVIFSAALIGVGSLSKQSGRREEAKALERAMADAVGDMIISGITDRERIAKRMWEARDAFIQKRMRKMI